MAFCTNCGQSVTGQFCTNCGQPVGGAQPEAAPPSPPPPPPAYSAQPAPSGRSPWMWVLFGCLGLLVIGGIIAIGTTYFVASKVAEHVDPDQWAKNPGLAATKMLAALNPDLEVVEVNERRGVIKVREKSTGKTVTLDFEKIKRGDISFESEEGGRVDIRGGGESGKIEITTPEGTMQIGKGAGNLPDWVPSYPGAAEVGSMSATGQEGKGGTYTFKTSDSVDEVAEFYEKALTERGFKVERSETRVGGEKKLVLLRAEEEGGKRHAGVTIAHDKETGVNVVYGVK